VLLLVAEFTTLFDVRTAASATVIKSVGTGSHDAYALVPIALLPASSKLVNGRSSLITVLSAS
jgi:hypothetical protein